MNNNKTDKSTIKQCNDSLVVKGTKIKGRHRTESNQNIRIRKNEIAQFDYNIICIIEIRYINKKNR